MFFLYGAYFLSQIQCNHSFCTKRCHSSCNIGTSLALGPLDQRGWGGGGGLIADREELGPGF